MQKKIHLLALHNSHFGQFSANGFITGKINRCKDKADFKPTKKRPWLQTNLFFKRKGVYPYEHIENFARFDETQHLQMKKKETPRLRACQKHMEQI